MRQRKEKTPRTSEPIDEARLNALCFEWQARLRLLDWNVVVKFARGYELNGADGDCDICSNLKKATIRIVAQGDYIGTDPYDPEQILVHELTHLHLAPFAPTDWATVQGVLMEQAIDLLACGLVKAKRGQ